MIANRISNAETPPGNPYEERITVDDAPIGPTLPPWKARLVADYLDVNLDELLTVAAGQPCAHCGETTRHYDAASEKPLCPECVNDYTQAQRDLWHLQEGDH